MTKRITTELRSLALVAILISLTIPVLNGFSTAQDQTALITAQIVEARDYTESFVVLAKQSLGQNPTDLMDSQKLYASAYAKYNAWVQYVKTSLQDGRAKNLLNDENYQKIAAEASGAATEFTSFVNSKTGAQSKTIGITAIISGLGDLGLKLWNGIKDRQKSDREAAATAFEKDAKWLPWQDIKSELAK